MIFGLGYLANGIEITGVNKNNDKGKIELRSMPIFYS